MASTVYPVPTFGLFRSRSNGPGAVETLPLPARLGRLGRAEGCAVLLASARIGDRDSKGAVAAGEGRGSVYGHRPGLSLSRDAPGRACSSFGGVKSIAKDQAFRDSGSLDHSSEYIAFDTHQTRYSGALPHPRKCHNKLRSVSWSHKSSMMVWAWNLRLVATILMRMSCNATSTTQLPSTKNPLVSVSPRGKGRQATKPLTCRWCR